MTTARRDREAVNETVVRRVVGTQQELTLRAASSDHVELLCEDLSWNRHACVHSKSQAENCSPAFQSLLSTMSALRTSRPESAGRRTTGFASETPQLALAKQSRQPDNADVQPRDDVLSSQRRRS